MINKITSMYHAVPSFYDGFIHFFSTLETAWLKGPGLIAGLYERRFQEG